MEPEKVRMAKWISPVGKSSITTRFVARSVGLDHTVSMGGRVAFGITDARRVICGIGPGRIPIRRNCDGYFRLFHDLMIMYPAYIPIKNPNHQPFVAPFGMPIPKRLPLIPVL